MASGARLARSSVRPETPASVHEGWEVSKAKSSAKLRLSDLTPVTKVLVRTSRSSPMGLSLACEFGRAVRNSAAHLVAGTGPDEWTVFAPAASVATVFATLEGSDQPDLATVLDMTHAGVLFRLTGLDAARTLEKVCAIDFSEKVTPNGAVFRSSVARVTTEVIRDDVAGVRSYLLHSDRSSGQYHFDALLDAGAEFDIAVDGYPEKEI